MAAGDDEQVRRGQSCEGCQGFGTSAGEEVVDCYILQVM